MSFSLVLLCVYLITCFGPLPPIKKVCSFLLLSLSALHFHSFVQFCVLYFLSLWPVLLLSRFSPSIFQLFNFFLSFVYSAVGCFVVLPTDFVSWFHWNYWLSPPLQFFSSLFFRVILSLAFMSLSFCVLILTGFCFFMVFSLANLLFMLNVILTNMWSLPVLSFVVTSQTVTIRYSRQNLSDFLLLHLVTPKSTIWWGFFLLLFVWGFFRFWNSFFAMISLCFSADSILSRDHILHFSGTQFQMFSCFWSLLLFF